MSEHPGKNLEVSPLKRALIAVKDLTTRLEKAERARHEPIAIVGMGCRFPGADGVEPFWNLLRRGESAVGEVPRDRWDIDAYFDPDPEKAGSMYTRRGGFIQSVDQFDPRFFGISPREAQSMDPQQRLLLEVSWEALEDAAQSPLELVGSSTGVFIGISSSDYGVMLNAAAGPARDLYAGTGSALSIAAGRLSYCLGLNGPALSIDTACSSSLVGVHLAIQSLRNDECSLALAGGVNLMFSPEATVLACRGRMLSPDGNCKTFDARADGYVRGEGCGIVVLKRLRDAVAAGDRVLAVLRGSAVNQDGRSSGLTAPNGAAQEALLRAALRDAQLTPGQVGYLEAHGTGTNLGDPIEMRAIQAVFCEDRDSRHPLRVGSVKTNIGHLEPAAGIAGLIKVVASMVHEAIPPHLNFETPNPNIPWDGVPVEIPTQLTRWPRTGELRCAGVSAFGFSGTNVHVVVQEAPDRIVSATDSDQPAVDSIRLLTLSGRSERALKQQASNLEQHLLNRSPEEFADACFTANVGRARFDHRLAVVAASAAEAGAKLHRFADGGTGSVITGVEARVSAPRIAFLFTGQGSQHAGMGRSLFESQPVFRAAVEECDEALGAIDGRRLIDLLYGLDDAAVAQEQLQRTGYAQPALFAVEYALTRLWRAWGIEPAAVMGHSVGEFGAACAAGVFTVRDGLTLIGARARLMQSLPEGGGMLAVSAGEARVTSALAQCQGSISIAAINGPEELVLSGSLVALHQIDEALTQAGVSTKFLNVSHAFHSALMQPMVAEFERVARGLTYARPALRLISNVTGRSVSDDEPMDAAYWRNHVLAPVRFGPSLEHLRALKYDMFLEIGPHPILTSLGRTSDTGRTGVWLASMRRGKDEQQQLMETLGELFVRGIDFDARGLELRARRRKIALPTYPFQRERYWVDTRQEAARDKGPRAETALPGAGVRSALNGDVVFQADVSASSEQFLADHAVDDTVIFPAAGYVSVALAAAAQLDGVRSREVVDFSLHEAFLFEEGERRLVQTILSPAGDGAYRFGVYSAPSTGQSLPQWTRHASGEVRAIAGAETGRLAPTLEDTVGRDSTSLDPAAFYMQLEEVGIQYGPSYRRVRELSVGPGEAIGRIATAGAPSSMGVCPAVLDAVFQVLGAARGGRFSTTSDDDVFLPIGIRRLWVSDSLPAAGDLRSIARTREERTELRETITGDVWCFDDQGELVLAVEGFTAKRATREALMRSRPRRTDDWLYEVAWRPIAAPEVTSDPMGHWLVFADRSGTGAQLAAALDRAGATCTTVLAGSVYGEDADAFTINPNDPGDCGRLFAAVTARIGCAPAGVVHLWNLDLDSQGGELPERLLDFGTGSLLNLVQASIDADKCRPARMLVVTRGAQSASGAVNPMQAPALGFARTVAAEHPELACQIIDLDPGADHSGGTGEADQLLGEIGAIAPYEPQIAYRSGTRARPRLVRSGSVGADGGVVGVPDDRVRHTPPPGVFTPKATYLVTGGTGGLGLTVARWMVDHGARHLILVGRSGASPEAQLTLASLEQMGATVTVARADVASRGQLEDVFARVPHALPLRGIVHAAGCLDDGVVRQLTRDRLERVMAPKVQGAWNLHQLSQNAALDFFVLFSSAASVFGSPGQANYAAGNAFLDALSQFRRAQHLPGMSINWGAWSDVGMAARLDRRDRDRVAASGTGAIDPARGLDALREVMRRDRAQTVVLPIDWTAFARQFEGRGVPPFMAELVSTSPRLSASQPAGVPADNLLLRLVTCDPEGRADLAQTYVATQIEAVLGLNGIEVDQREPITSLGLDSLMAVELKNRFEADLGVVVPVVRLLKGPSVRELAEMLVAGVATDRADEAARPLAVAVEEGEF